METHSQSKIKDLSFEKRFLNLNLERLTFHWPEYIVLLGNRRQKIEKKLSPLENIWYRVNIKNWIELIIQQIKLEWLSVCTNDIKSWVIFQWDVSFSWFFFSSLFARCFWIAKSISIVVGMGSSRYEGVWETVSLKIHSSITRCIMGN